ncbi:MAG: putative LPS assembly protein LptD [Bacteriovoracales bacterium]|nr:putative LPS assembly protein LptD [Bacteriovoracales bacterium]
MRGRAVLLLFLIWPTIGLSRERLSIAPSSFSDDLSILADKAFRREKDGVFKVIGNVIINRGAETLYGEVGKVDLKEGIIYIEGNVRFTSQNISIYGSKLIYDTIRHSLEAFNARVLSKSFSLHGKYIELKPDKMLKARNVEYTNCLDCPESWSIYGAHIKITFGEYVTIKDAVMKIYGVPTVYLPYFIFPIKKGRASGLLFPKIYRSSTTKGFTFKQPFFWAIDRSRDMTFSPSLFGERGLGGEFEYRSAFGQGRWMRLNNLSVFDKNYRPFGADSLGDRSRYSRYFSHYEHNFRWGNRGNHHLTVNKARDKDIVRDFMEETKDFYYGNELGTEGFFEWKGDRFQLSLAGYFMDDLITNDPTSFDDRTVQVLPRISFATTPFQLFKTKYSFLNSLTLGLQGEMTNFRQNLSTDEPGTPIRNVQRGHLLPSIDLVLGSWGPVKLRSYLDWDHQFYRLPEVVKTFRVSKEDRFEKWAFLAKHELSFELDRIYGLAYQVTVPESRIKWLKGEDTKKARKSDPAIIGDLPPFEESLVKDEMTIKKRGYRHVQEWKLSHYQFLDSGYSGNLAFKEQLENRTVFFDIIDSFRGKEVEISASQSQTKLPLENVIELQWNNTLIRKAPVSGEYFAEGVYQKNLFDYKRIFYFNISQGLNLSRTRENGEFSGERLTRLALDLGLELDRLSLTAKEFYFYNGKHIHELSLNSLNRYVDFSLGVFLNSVDEETASNSVNVGLEFRPMSSLTFKSQYDFDLDSRDENNRQSYEGIYTPTNGCWRLRAGFSDDTIETKYWASFQVLWNSSFRGFF